VRNGVLRNTNRRGDDNPLWNTPPLGGGPRQQLGDREQEAVAA
jgi:hypothetical protein